jgi:hypothetical protein
MSQPDFSALLRWPDVPACYGWLSLDRRGQWRLRGEAVTHAGLTGFLNRQYAHDELGNYFVQNGPQRVFVELDYAPWVVWLTSSPAEAGASFTLQTHSGEPVTAICQACIDEEGNLLLELPMGVALVCDRDLPTMLHALRDREGVPADDDALRSLLEWTPESAPEAGGLVLHWRDQRIPVSAIRRVDVARRFGYVASPQASARP